MKTALFGSCKANDAITWIRLWQRVYTLKAEVGAVAHSLIADSETGCSHLVFCYSSVQLQ